MHELLPLPRLPPLPLLSKMPLPGPLPVPPPLLPPPPLPYPNPSTACPEQRCSHLKKTYGVQPGMSWGSLTADGKAEWAQLGCDDKLPSNDGEPAPTRSEQPGRWWAALPMNGPDSSANGSTSADVYEPSWGSLLRYEGPPEWYRDAKLGIFFHWGVRRARAAPAPA